MRDDASRDCLDIVSTWELQELLNNFESCKTRVSYGLVIFCEEHQCRLLRKGSWSLFEVSVRITEEGEVSKEEHEVHLKLMLESRRKEKQYAKFSKSSWCKNGGNGRCREYFHSYALFLYSGRQFFWVHFLNFFNDPRIIYEQMISAYKGYRGGGVVRVLEKGGLGEERVLGQMTYYVYKSTLDVLMLDDVPLSSSFRFVIIVSCTGSRFIIDSINLGDMLMASPKFADSSLVTFPSMLCGSWACAFHQDKASSVKVPIANVTLSSSAHLLRENSELVREFSLDVDVLIGRGYDKDEDNDANGGNDDEREISWKQ
ncbi:hypothetical protein Tco_1081501 [Tanacetum coccineum]|uniref:Uncharacterized protein n=1 Tax=Tanacetum coccineum TaxID=301880 RepID=A0ABQ5HXK8_9ASTR